MAPKLLLIPRSSSVGTSASVPGVAADTAVLSVRSVGEQSGGAPLMMGRPAARGYYLMPAVVHIAAYSPVQTSVADCAPLLMTSARLSVVTEIGSSRIALTSRLPSVSFTVPVVLG